MVAIAERLSQQDTILLSEMPFGVFGSRGSIKFSKKRTYSVQHNLENGGRSSDSLSRRRSSAPAGILKKSGRSSRPTSYPALAEGMVPSEMAAAVPMPSEVELNMMFAQMVVSVIKLVTIIIDLFFICSLVVYTKYCTCIHVCTCIRMKTSSYGVWKFNARI